ncbi:MAG: methionyl-tRNA formyltransferase [Acidimicrobiales bacterium]
MRLVYLGTPAMAVPPLRAIVDAGHDVALVVSQPDKRRGRGGALRPSPVKAAAVEVGLRVSDRVDDILDLDPPPALGVVVAFGRLIRAHVLERVPMINLHFSLLPRWRGAAPVERAILEGDTRSGVAVMAIEETLDTGPIYDEAEVDIGPEESADELRARLTAIGTALILGVLDRGLELKRHQRGESTYARKLEVAELELDWSRPAAELHRIVRVGGAWTTFRGRRFKVWRASVEGATRLAPGELDGTAVGTGHGTLWLIDVQPEGKPREAADDWVRGARLRPGDRLGS